MELTEQRTITKQQYQQLLGLKVLALKHSRAMQEILEANAEILGIEGKGPHAPFGHVEDMTFDDGQDVDETLRKVGVRVEE